MEHYAEIGIMLHRNPYLLTSLRMRQEAFEQQPPRVVEVFVDQPLG
jgi:hypothetical protein